MLDTDQDLFKSILDTFVKPDCSSFGAFSWPSLALHTLKNTFTEVHTNNPASHRASHRKSSFTPFCETFHTHLWCNIHRHTELCALTHNTSPLYVSMRWMQLQGWKANVLASWWRLFCPYLSSDEKHTIALLMKVNTCSSSPTGHFHAYKKCLSVYFCAFPKNSLCMIYKCFEKWGHGAMSSWVTFTL